MRREKFEPLGVPDIADRGADWSKSTEQEPRGGRVTALDRRLARQLLAAVGSPPFRLVLWNGETVAGSDDKNSLVVRFRDRGAMLGLLYDPELRFGDLYSSGRIDVEGDLLEFVETAYRALDVKLAHSPWHHRLSRLRNRPRSNSLTGSRSNIHHHYDLGNEFYRLWLDREVMQYTCAYYPDPTMTLEQAQVAKLHHVCRKLRLQPGQTVAEAGCGWGGLARFMAKHYGVKVRAYNISHEQVSFARERAAEEGLAERVEYVEDDYRNIRGDFDVFVSVGMLEHVGTDHYRELGGVIDRCLKDDGRGLIHTIGRNQAGLMNAWIEKRIFPGAYPPTLGQMMEIFEPWEFSVQDVENLRLHYARTLTHWLERFDQNLDKIEDMFDERFIRAWRLYLVGSIAAFTTGSLQLFQVVFERPRTNELPWSRAHLYAGDHPQ
ncbi:MAG TPA: cyclopropane-fatty-acyl-phospholipid synthase family protein [Gammaproteobacteria bacterium]|nr:cyclopropane-fatty-acyl-phospholipid synthase family protein [Gammaproteobacteria bacterium]